MTGQKRDNDCSMLKNLKLKRILYWTFVLFFTLGRYMMMVTNPVWSYPDYPYDDSLLTRLAQSIINGNWLGEYDQYIFIKGVSFPLFLAFNNILHIPYMVSLFFLYFASSALMAIAIKPWIKSRWICLGVYVYFLFSPIGFMTYTTQRIYRMAIVVPVVTWIIASAIAVFVRRDAQVFKQIKWYISLGFSLAFYWLLREEAILVVPLIIGSLVLVILWNLCIKKENGKKKLMRLSLSLIPLCIVTIYLLIVMKINYSNYGLYVLSDRTGTSFKEVSCAIRDIDEVCNDENVWVSREAIQQAMNNSPTLKKYEEEILEQWDSWSAVRGRKDGEIIGDDFIWAIRGAIANSGYYVDLMSTNNLYTTIADELEIAYSEGVLERRKGIGISSSVKPLTMMDIVNTLEKTIAYLPFVASYNGCDAHIPYVENNVKELEMVEKLTWSDMISEETAFEEFELEGWIFAVSDSAQLSVEVADGEKVIAKPQFLQSDDVYEVYSQFVNSKIARLDFKLSNIDAKELFVNVYINDMMIKSYDIRDVLADKYIYYDGEDYKVYFNRVNAVMDSEKYGVRNGDFLNININVQQKIIFQYKKFGNLLLAISIISYILSLFTVIKNRKWDKTFDMFITSTGIFLGLILQIFAVIFFSWHGVYLYYLSAVVPMLQAFEVIVIIGGVQLIYSNGFKKCMAHKGAQREERQ